MPIVLKWVKYFNELLGHHPETGEPIYLKIGRYGSYVEHDRGKELGKEYRAIKAPDEVLSITLDRAIELLAQPSAASRNKTK